MHFNTQSTLYTSAVPSLKCHLVFFSLHKRSVTKKRYFPWVNSVSHYTLGVPNFEIHEIGLFVAFKYYRCFSQR